MEQGRFKNLTSSFTYPGYINNKCFSAINNGVCPITLSNKRDCNLIMQGDGNLVIYDPNDSPIWASNTEGKGTPKYKYIMQQDGNLVIYDKFQNPIWASNTRGVGKAPYTLTLTNNCTITITDKNNRITYSNCGCSLS